MDKLNLKFLQLGYGRYGYKAAAICDSGGVQVYWDGFKDEMGVHVQISGQGCRLIESLEGFDSWREWIGRWIEDGARVARIDLAIDDEAGTVDFETVHKAVESRSAVMRSRKTRLILDKDLDSGASYPTLYVGRRTSETMMRCYDKGLQTKSGTSWLRFEFEYKGERADAVARLLVSEGWDAAIGTVRSFIEFKDETHVTSDRTRQRAASWWVQLVDASKHVLRIEREVHASLMKTYMWLKRQASTAIATLLEYEGGDMSWMIELAKEGKPKLKARHLAMLRNAGPSVLGAAT